MAASTMAPCFAVKLSAKITGNGRVSTTKAASKPVSCYGPDRVKNFDGPATILAIGTANPSNCVDQSTYPDFLFRVTNNEHKVELKEKFQRICDKSMIKKRYLHLTEEILEKNPSICEYKAPSFDARQEIATAEVQKLGKEAAERAIEEWGQPKSKITHFIFCTTSSVDIPGADYQLTKLLGLSPSVKRTMLYQQGCFGGGTTLRLAKDFAENNKGARVLVICCEVTVLCFHAPREVELDVLVGQAIFSDGASSIIIGSDPVPYIEKPLFDLVVTTQSLIPNSGHSIRGNLCEAGLIAHLQKDVPSLISENIEKILMEVFLPLGISDWNSIFWIAHPGGRAILDQIELSLGLSPEKLKASRHVMSEYGNMGSACVFFVLDEMRKSSIKHGLSTTGGGLEWGVLCAFGPGLTVETIVLRAWSL